MREAPPNPQEKTPLHFAMEFKQHEAIDLLVEKGADIKANVLMTPAPRQCCAAILACMPCAPV
jgi:ankyrin repeat protein